MEDESDLFLGDNEIEGSLVKESLDDIRGSKETQGWGQIERSGSLRLDNFD